MNDEKLAFGIGSALIFFGIIIFVVLLWAWPNYKVWQREKSGQAELAEAEWSKKIAVEEAKAKLESEKLNAQSEVVRANGVAEANKIIAESIDEQYIRYLWVKTLDGADKQIIYVPTEANLPVTEASRLLQPTQNK